MPMPRMFPVDSSAVVSGSVGMRRDIGIAA
jgi:hypothetical protein